MSHSTVVPDDYVDREQALIKHLLLKGYLEKLFLIMGSSGATELCYIDCFAGPWDVEDDALGSTSIAISLQILARCQAALARQGKNPRIRALFVEKNAKSYGRLCSLLATNTPHGIETRPMHGDFLSLRDEILKWCGSRSFGFFFVDPTGWSPVTIQHLQPLLHRADSEFLITFMYDWINRTASMPGWQDRVRDLLGELPNLVGLPPIEREKAILGTYRKNLCTEMGGQRHQRARSAYVRVLDPTKERPKYHLVYLTRHPLGIIEFMQFSESVDIVQRQYRAAKQDELRMEKTGTPDMFGSQTYLHSGKAQLDSEEVEQYWLEQIGAAGGRFGEAEFAAMLEETNWFPTDLQVALGRLMAQKLVRNRSAKKARPKRPLHWEKLGEFLEPMDPEA